MVERHLIVYPGTGTGCCGAGAAALDGVRAALCQLRWPQNRACVGPLVQQYGEERAENTRQAEGGETVGNLRVRGRGGAPFRAGTPLRGLQPVQDSRAQERHEKGSREETLHSYTACIAHCLPEGTECELQH